MQLPDAEEFAGMYDDEELVAKFPDRPVTSLRDIQYVYGKLYTLATVGGGEYAPYLTPDQATDLLDEGDSLIVVRVDLSGDKPRLDTDEPVQVKNYKRDLIPKVAHSYYDSARGFDHSVTHRSGRGKEPEKLAEYAQNRLARWASDDVIQSAAGKHEDGWIIEALAELGEDEEALETIEREVTRQIDETATSLLTVQVKLDDNAEYLYPGDVEAFNEAMKQHLLSKLVSKGEAKDSKGEAVDMVSGKEGTTVGTSEDPLNYYLGKQMEKFPGFDPDEAWRTHPVSEDSALNVNNADPFVDACTYTTFGATVYYLPYLIGKPDAQGLRNLYALLWEIVDREEMTPVEAAYDKYERGELEGMENVRFYVTAVMKHQQKRFDVYGETMDGRLYHPVDLARAHQILLGTWAFDDTETDGRVSAAFGVPPESEDEEDDSWQLLRGGVGTTDFVSIIASGWYFRSTFPSPDDDQNASADDARIHALVSVLSGEGIEVGELLKLYADRLTEESGDSFPRFTVASQYAQMCALAEADLLNSKRENREPITEPPEYDEGFMTRQTALADGGSTAAARERKLAQFLEQTPALEDDERRAAFLLGALVGEVSSYQSSPNMGVSTTMIDQHPVKAMTKPKLKRVTEDVLNKDIVYSRENDMGSTMKAEVVDRLRDTILKHEDIEDWGIRTEDLRFYYALGVTYGMNSYVSDEETENEEN